MAIAKAVQSKPSEFGTRYLILYGNVLGETTLWQDVKRVLPASVLRLSQNGIKQSTYWTFDFDQAISKLPIDESVDYVISTLSRTMRRGLAREGKVWLSLTGGFDSRTLAAMVYHSELPFKV